VTYPNTTETRDRFLRRYGAGRWTAKDLWMSTMFPDRDWPEQCRRDMAPLSFVEEYPGPRGGLGWRVKPEIADAVLAEWKDVEGRQARRNGPHRDSAAAVRSRFARVKVDEAKHTITASYPMTNLGPGRDGTVTMNHIVAGYAARGGKLGPISPVKREEYGWDFTAEWRHAATLQAVIDKIDRLLADRLEKRASYLEAEARKVRDIIEGSKT
jgi:hypothetical protein